MAVLKLLLTGGIIFIAAIFFFSDRVLGYNPDIIDHQIYRLSKDIIPVRYEINITLYVDEPTGNIAIDGELNAIIDIKRTTKQINFHASHIIIKTINLTDAENHEILDTHRKFSPETQMFEIHMPKGISISPGRYKLNIIYNRMFISEGSFFRTSYIHEGNKEWIIATTIPPIGARQIFPCWDEPALRAEFRIWLKHQLDNKFIILFNTGWYEKEILPKNMTRLRYVTTSKISPHQVAIVILNRRSIKFISIGDFHKLQSRPKVTVEFAGMIIDCIEKYLESKIFSDFLRKQYIDYIAIPHFLYEGMSQWGVVFYREEAITYDEKLDLMARKIEVMRLVAHYIAQQWFGDLVSPSWWSFWWFNDALATFVGMDIINKCFPDVRIMDMLVVQYQHESLHLDFYSYYTTYPLEVNSPSEINSLFSSFKTSYKVISIFRMLQHLITDLVFWNGMRQYTITYKFSSTTPDNFWAAMETALNKASFNVEPELIQTIRKVNHWFKLKYTVLKAWRTDQWLDIELETEETLKIDWIPVTFTTQGKLDFNQTLFRNIKYINTKDSRIRFTLNDTYGWVIINLQQAGYYRVNYNLENWQGIATYLNSKNYSKIHVINRAQIIDDAFHFTIVRQLDPIIFWNLTSYLSRETDYVAWYPMIKAMEYMSNIFPLPDKKVSYIKRKLLKILTPVLYEIEYKAMLKEPKLTSCLREETAKWACVLGDRTCKRKAAQLLNWHLSNREEHKLTPWWQSWAYCKGLKGAKGATWYDLIDKWKSEPNNRILEFLSCSENPLIIHHSLKTLPIISPQLFGQENDTNIMNNLNNFFFIVARHAKNKKMLKYILQNFDEIKPKQFNMNAALIIIISHVYSKERLDEISEFVEKKIRVFQTNLHYKIVIKYRMEKNLLNNKIKQLVLNLQNVHTEFPDVVNNEIELIRSDVQNKIESYLFEIKHIATEKLQQITSIIQRKITKRRSEIEKQIKYLQIFSNSKYVKIY